MSDNDREKAIREIIDEVCCLKSVIGDHPGNLATLIRIERKLGGLLPPIRGVLMVGGRTEQSATK